LIERVPVLKECVSSTACGIWVNAAVSERIIGNHGELHPLCTRRLGSSGALHPALLPRSIFSIAIVAYNDPNAGWLNEQRAKSPAKAELEGGLWSTPELMLNAEVAAWNRLEAKVKEAIDLAKALGSLSDLAQSTI
jgi:hypothetical protein